MLLHIIVISLYCRHVFDAEADSRKVEKGLAEIHMLDSQVCSDGCISVSTVHSDIGSFH